MAAKTGALYLVTFAAGLFFGSYYGYQDRNRWQNDRRILSAGSDRLSVRGVTLERDGRAQDVRDAAEDMEVTLARLEALATPVGEPKPLFGYEVVATLLKHIRELQKAGRDCWKAATEEQIDALSAERKRREEAEAALLDLIIPLVNHVNEHGADGYLLARLSDARAYCSRYPSESDNRTKVAG